MFNSRNVLPSCTLTVLSSAQVTNMQFLFDNIFQSMDVTAVVWPLIVSTKLPSGDNKRP